MTDKWEGGKGDRQRRVDHKKFESNWDRIFGKKDEKKLNNDKPHKDSRPRPS